jgi:hypothetical protein
MVMLPIVVSSNTFLPDRTGVAFVIAAVVDGAAAVVDAGAVVTTGVWVAATVVASVVGSVVVACVCVVPAGEDWVHPAQNTSAAARRPRIQSVRIGDILKLLVPQENRDYGVSCLPALV